MISLLTEVHIVDGRMYTIMQNQDSLYKYGTGRYMAVFNQFHTDSVHFKNSLKYYALNPDDMSAIYDQVLINLKAKTDSLNKLQINRTKLHLNSNHGLPNKQRR